MIRRIGKLADGLTDRVIDQRPGFLEAKSNFVKYEFRGETSGQLAREKVYDLLDLDEDIPMTQHHRDQLIANMRDDDMDQNGLGILRADPELPIPMIRGYPLGIPAPNEEQHYLALNTRPNREDLSIFQFRQQGGGRQQGQIRVDNHYICTNPRCLSYNRTEFNDQPIRCIDHGELEIVLIWEVRDVKNEEEAAVDVIASKFTMPQWEDPIEADREMERKVRACMNNAISHYASRNNPVRDEYERERLDQGQEEVKYKEIPGSRRTYQEGVDGTREQNRVQAQKMLNIIQTGYLLASLFDRVYLLEDDFLPIRPIRMKFNLAKLDLQELRDHIQGKYHFDPTLNPSNGNVNLPHWISTVEIPDVPRIYIKSNRVVAYTGSSVSDYILGRKDGEYDAISIWQRVNTIGGIPPPAPRTRNLFWTETEADARRLEQMDNLVWYLGYLFGLQNPFTPTRPNYLFLNREIVISHDELVQNRALINDLLDTQFHYRF